MADPLDPRVSIGHVHLKVSDLDRAVAFYAGVLGFDVTSRMGDSAVRSRPDPLDVNARLAEARQGNSAASRSRAAGTASPDVATLSDATRDRLSQLRARLLALHKTLLDDARVAYEMDRGSVSSK